MLLKYQFYLLWRMKTEHYDLSEYHFKSFVNSTKPWHVLHTSALTGGIVLSTSLRLALLLGKWNSPKLFKCEWDMTDWVWLWDPDLSNFICHMTCIPPTHSSVASLPQTAKPQTEALLGLAPKPWCDRHHLHYAFAETVAKRVAY